MTADTTGPVPDDVIDAVAQVIHANDGTLRSIARDVLSVPAVAAVFARDTKVRELAADVTWLARLARGSSWPLDMAEHVERAADRVVREFGTDADRAALAAIYPEDGAR